MTAEFILRLLVAGVLGIFIGLEREYRAKEAGYRTHFLVALGSALIMVVSQHGFDEVLGRVGVGLDPSRIAAQVVTGIGFIGAGTIILNKQIVRGLTTAAGIWATAAIGLCVGAGMYMLGVLATLLALVGLELLSRIFRRLGLKSYIIEFSTLNKAVLDSIPSHLNAKDIVIVSYQMDERAAAAGATSYYVTMVVKFKGNNNDVSLINHFNAIDDIVIHRVE
ncbi:MAG: MgtC/SapB family protein [Bacteroidaceae bacterium]|nr:MgtC/SapB family protein [Bacteroidaceae bacterium]